MYEKESSILFFDGVCNLCSSAVQFILQHEVDHNLKFASLQSELGKYVLKTINQEDLKPESLILIMEGQIFMKSTAVSLVAQHLGLPWRLVGWLNFIPLAIRDRLYDMVAKNRYKIFGKRTQCWMPEPSQIHRFL